MPFSISAWINKEGDGHQGIFTSDNTISGNYYGFWFAVKSNNTLSIAYGDGSDDGPLGRRNKASSSTIQNNTWAFVTAVVKGPNDMDLYIDGVNAGGSCGGSGGPMVHNSYKAVIGLLSKWGPYYFDGIIDDVRIYGRALYDEEVWQLYQNAPTASSNAKNVAEADINVDGVVDFQDFTILMNNWLKPTH